MVAGRAHGFSRNTRFDDEFLTEKAKCFVNSIGGRLVSWIKHPTHNPFVNTHSTGQGKP